MNILSNMDNPGQLEKLYRENKTLFKTEFNHVYPQITDNKLAAFWNERLNYEGSDISWGSKNELTFVVIASLIAGLIAKLPAFWGLNEELFYQRNAGFIVFPLLTIYFIWKKELSLKKVVIAASVILIALVFINLLPANEKSDTLILSCIHLPLLLWAVLGFSYTGNTMGRSSTRLDFLKYNGDLAIMTGLLGIAGAMLTGVTFGLFSVIGIDIEKFYSEYVAVFGLAALPVVATFITQTNPQLVNKVSPVIAKIFSPLVLIMLVVYLTAIVVTGKDPYNDRDFLMIFNMLLIGVMAIIFFSVAESSRQRNDKASAFILFALSIATIIVNGIALSAILFRISEWGITPNRLAVTGANLLMLSNLFIVSFKLYRIVFKKADYREAGTAISLFIPAYILWTIIVVFLFPLLFQFK